MKDEIACPDCGSIFGGDIFSADPARRRYFAIIRESWQNLRPPWSDMFSSSEALRKYCLIKAGWCDTTTVVAGSRKAAQDVAEAMRRLDRYALVEIRGDVLTIHVAKSQTRRHQPKALFVPCAEQVYRILSEMLGTDVEQAA